MQDHVRLSRDLRRPPELAPLAALLRLARRKRERRLGLEKVNIAFDLDFNIKELARLRHS